MNKKKILLILFALGILGIFQPDVRAASLTLSRSSSTVKVGSTVKVTAKISGALNYTYSNFSFNYDKQRFSFVSSSDNCNALNCLVEGNNSVTLTFKALTEGDAVFKATGSFEDDASGSLSAQTNVKVTNGSTSDSNPSKVLGSNNNLASLSVEGYEINFNKDLLEYSLSLASDVTSLNIKATAEDKNATVGGIGQRAVSEGSNTLEVVVTAENGSKKTYVIKANVEEKQPIVVKVNDDNLNVVKNTDLLTKPLDYEEITINIDGVEVPAFYSDITKFTLVGLKDEDGNISLYIYDESQNTYSLYQELNLNGLKLKPLTEKKTFKNYIKESITINDLKIEAFKFKSKSEFAIIYALNLETNEKDFYVLDLTNNTALKYDDEYVNYLEKKIDNYLLVIYSLGAVVALALIIILTLCIKNSRRKKKIKHILNKISGTTNDEVLDKVALAEEVSTQDEMYNLFEDDK